jgi:two-component system alkaline phosphatase synthesis response regulator PhoP
MSKVLLIEDDPTMLSLLGTLLDMEGFQVVKIENFSTVLSVIRTESPDVILMDVNLMDVNGLDILSEIRNDASLNGMPVIMSSGMDFKRESLDRGANDFIQKPYMPDELIDKVKLLSSNSK